MYFRCFCKKSSKSTNLEKNSFNDAIKIPVLIGQISLVPFSKENITYFNIRVIIAFILTFCQFLMALLSIIWLSKCGVSIFKGGTVLFFGGASIMTLLMIRVAKKWPSLIEEWTEVERFLGYQENLTRKFAIISLTTILFSTDIVFLSTKFIWIDKSAEETLKLYATGTFPQVFDVIDYTPLRAIPLYVINTLSSLTVFATVDIFIILASVSLSGCFTLYNENLINLTRKKIHLWEWRVLRRKYSCLRNLTATVDDCFCHLLGLAFLMHIYIICMGMHQGILFVEGKNKFHAILSFLVSVVRACAVCFTSVEIFEKSRNILPVLYSVPTSDFNAEIAGTIISCEMVLIQIRGLSGVNT